LINNEIIFFFIYCIIGWICEEIYCSFLEKKVVNRGFLNGPYLPIYGFGAIIVLYLLKPFIDNIIILFFVAVVVTSIIEYGGSFILETIFHIKLWDYSSKFMNINGRVCLLNSLLFGILSVVIIYLIHPFVSFFVYSLSDIIQYYFTLCIVIGMSFDLALSIAKMNSFNAALDEFKDRSEEIKERLKVIGANESSEFINSIKERWNEEGEFRKARLVRRHKRLLLAFPSMKSDSNFIDSQFDKIKDDFSAWLLKGKNQYRELKAKRKNASNK